MRIGIISQWYDPEPGPAGLPGVLARGLLARGHTVQVLTGFPNYPSGVVAKGYRLRRVMDEELGGVQVRRVAVYPSHDESSARRILNYASFGVSATVSGLDSLRGIDAVWIYNSPITTALPMWGARYGLRTPCVLHVMDLWPDTLHVAGFAYPGRGRATGRRLLSSWAGAMYRAADSVAYISPGVGDVLRKRGVPEAKLRYVPMWADEEIFHPSSENFRQLFNLSDDAIVLLYAGALGHAQSLNTLIDACAQVHDPRFVCLIAGSGTAEQDLRKRARAVGASNIRFLGRLPQEKMTALMATGDLNYIGLRPHALSGVTMPSKTQAALASGRALLVAAHGDVARVARDSGAGWAVEPGDVSAIAAAIRSACGVGREELRRMGVRARTYYKETFSVDQGVGRIEALLKRAVDSRARNV